MIEITTISEEHVECFHRTLDTVARERRYLAFLEAPPLEATRSFVRHMITQGQPQFVALSGSNVVGWCDISRHSDPVHTHAGTLGMGLLQPFRGQGIGTRLIRPTLAAAQAIGMARVELSVYETNASAIALYERVGFTVEGLSRNAARIDGVYENVVQMALLF